MNTTLAAALAIASLAAAQAPPSGDALLARLAIDLASERDVAPLSLDADGHARHGVAYDRFTKAHLAARVAAARGAPFDALHPPAALLHDLLVIVAVPLTCGGRTMTPSDVDLDNQGTPVPKWQPAKGRVVQTVLPGGVVPAGAIAVQFNDTELRPGETVQISYADPCPGAARTVTLPVTSTRPRALDRPRVELAAGEAAPPGPVTLTLGGVLDLDGRLRYATVAETLTPFLQAALRAAGQMHFEPARINGSPTPWTAGVVVTFGSSPHASGATTGPARSAPTWETGASAAARGSATGTAARPTARRPASRCRRCAGYAP